MAAQKVFAAKVEGREPAAEKCEAKRRVVTDRVDNLLENFIAQRLSKNRSVAEISRLLRREVGRPWAGRSIHELTKRDVVEVVSAVTARRGERGDDQGDEEDRNGAGHEEVLLGKSRDLLWPDGGRLWRHCFDVR